MTLDQPSRLSQEMRRVVLVFRRARFRGGFFWRVYSLCAHCRHGASLGEVDVAGVGPCVNVSGGLQRHGWRRAKPRFYACRIFISSSHFRQ